MPCDSGDRYGGVCYVDRQETIESLCECCRAIEGAGLLATLSERTQHWWMAHKKADEARNKAEMERATKAAKKRAVLAKLSPEERKILGVHDEA